jgi:hypothetical protein
VPDLPAGQSLGLGSAVHGQARIKFPPGAIIALYTDGLVETRTRSFDQDDVTVVLVRIPTTGTGQASRRSSRQAAAASASTVQMHRIPNPCQGDSRSPDCSCVCVISVPACSGR